MSDARAILALNAGSSTLKCALFDLAGELGGAVLFRLTLSVEDGETHEQALARLLDRIAHEFPEYAVVAAGHRVVHGGTRFADPVRVDRDVLAALRELIPLAPLHQPHALNAIDALARLHPGLPQVACFDTAFHRGQPAVATTIALPRVWRDAGVRRYGFHGLSCEYVASTLPALAGGVLPRRTIVAHLGSGASLTALDRGRSVATTMGFSALDGLVMGTRPGSLDPGVVLYLLQQGIGADAIGDILWQRSGLIGVSGISEDMRTLLASSEPAARDAVALFVYHIVRETGSLAAALGGLDAFVFTAGIGEHAPEIRARVCDELAWLGFRLDGAGNAAGATRISAPESAIGIFVIPTDEEAVVARHTTALLGLGP